MTREEWINEILIPWKPGGVLEFKSDIIGRWFAVNVASNEDFDPMGGYTPDLAHGTFRIKLREARWFVDVGGHIQSYVFGKIANSMQYCHEHDIEKFSDGFIEAIRNAKRLA